MPMFPDIRRDAALGLGGHAKPQRFLPRFRIRITKEIGKSNEEAEAGRDLIGTAYAHRRFRQATVIGEGRPVPVFQQYVEYILPAAPWLTGIMAETEVPELGEEGMGTDPLGLPDPGSRLQAGLHPPPGLWIEDLSDNSEHKIISAETTPEGRVMLRCRGRTS